METKLKAKLEARTGNKIEATLDARTGDETGGVEAGIGDDFTGESNSEKWKRNQK